LAWKYIGDKGYQDRIDHLFSLAKLAESKVNQSRSLKLLSPVESLNICFRIQTPLVDESRWNELTIEVRERLIVETDTLVNHASINDENCIRLITANFDLTPKDIDKFMNNVEIISQKVIHELNS
jgi:sulfinoalanine decarboxylase